MVKHLQFCYALIAFEFEKILIDVLGDKDSLWESFKCTIGISLVPFFLHASELKSLSESLLM